MAYKYTVVSYLPDVVTDEYVNIGIILHDMDSKVVLKKFTKNVEEMNRRYAHGHEGVKRMHELFLSGWDDIPDIEQDREYLLKEHEKERGIYNRIFYRQPYGGILSKEGKLSELKDILEHLYEMFITIDKKEIKQNGM